MRPPSENNLSAAALESIGQCSSVHRGDAHVDGDPEMKVLCFVPDLYSRKLSHIISNFVRTDGCTDCMNTLSYLLYLAVRENRGTLVFLDQLAIPISNISIDNTNTSKYNKRIAIVYQYWKKVLVIVPIGILYCNINNPDSHRELSADSRSPRI